MDNKQDFTVFSFSTPCNIRPESLTNRPSLVLKSEKVKRQRVKIRRDASGLLDCFDAFDFWDSLFDDAFDACFKR